MEQTEIVLKLERGKSTKRGTPGVLSFGEGLTVFTVEDPVREPAAGRPSLWEKLVAWVKSWKIAGDTAIPSGRYRLAWTPSNRFRRETLQLLDVPGYGGIRIHAGNRKGDTEGCLLPGLTRDPNGVDVLDSRRALAKLEPVVRAHLDAGREVWIEIDRGTP